MVGTVIAFVYGVIFGSFINAVVWRIHVRKRITRGRSMCPECKHELAAMDLIPILSWIWLRGRCRYCKAPISKQYPTVELLTGALFALSYAAMHPVSVISWVLFGFWLYFVVSLTIVSVYDVRWLLLPDVVVLPAIGVALVMLAVVGIFIGWQPVLSAVLAAIVAGGAFYAIAAVSGGKWLGGGDIKLVFLMGLLLGASKMTLAMLIAFNSAAVIGIMLILLGIKSRKDYIPFGPFLVLGTIVAALYGDQIIQFYLGLNGLVTL